MLHIVLPLLMALGIAAVIAAYAMRKHFNSLIPPFRLDERHNALQVRRYPKLAVAEVRAQGTASVALSKGGAMLDRYFREGSIARFAMPLIAEKMENSPDTWTISALLPDGVTMEAAPAPISDSDRIQLKEIAAHRAVCRHLHGPVQPDEHLARCKSDMLVMVNDLCRVLGCTKLSTVTVMHRYPWWMPPWLRVSDLMVRVTDGA